MLNFVFSSHLHSAGPETGFTGTIFQKAKEEEFADISEGVADPSPLIPDLNGVPSANSDWMPYDPPLSTAPPYVAPDPPIVINLPPQPTSSTPSSPRQPLSSGRPVSPLPPHSAPRDPIRSLSPAPAPSASLSPIREKEDPVSPRRGEGKKEEKREEKKEEKKEKKGNIFSRAVDKLIGPAVVEKGGERGGGGGVSSTPKSPWACGRCTLENDGAAQRCKACGTMKPKERERERAKSPYTPQPSSAYHDGVGGGGLSPYDPYGGVGQSSPYSGGSPYGGRGVYTVGGGPYSSAPKGPWDCKQCTLVNPPTAVACEVCKYPR